MSVKVANNRLILSSSLQSYGELYQYLVKRISSIQSLGDWLIEKAETARTFRITKDLDMFAGMLSNFPVQEYKLIGHYYQGLIGYWKGENPQETFEEVFEKSRTYKAKALIGLAGLEARKSNYESELRLFTQALKFTNSPSLTMEISRSIAVVKAKEGFHPQSLKDLEKISPWLRHANLYVRCQYYNSCAVELCEVGRLEEARNLSNIVLASPYVIAYPEWRETGDDIALKSYRSSRSFVPITQGAIQDNIVHLPERESVPASQGEPGRVLHYDWESKMVKEPNDQIEDLEGMDEKDLMVKLLYLATHEGVTEKKLRKVVAYALKVFSEPKD